MTLVLVNVDPGADGNSQCSPTRAAVAGFGWPLQRVLSLAKMAPPEGLCRRLRTTRDALIFVRGSKAPVLAPRRNKQIVSFDNFTSRQGARTSSALKKQMVLKRQILLSVIELVDLSTRLFDCVTAHTPAAHASRSPAEIAPGREYLAQS